MEFFDKMEKVDNRTLTQNGAIANKSTLNACVDLFGMGATLINRESPSKTVRLFIKAFRQNKEVALKLLFYIRDVREGQGERAIGRSILKWLAINEPEIVIKNLKNIPFYGRWDDIYAILETKNKELRTEIATLIMKQLIEDIKSEYPSLLAKWLKSENTSSKESRKLARETISLLEITAPNYRKMLSKIRKKINILETTISNGEWDNIDYSKVPSQAMLKYRNAFYKHSPERFEAYLESLKKGETKINAGTLQPYELVNKIIDIDYWSLDKVRYDETIEELWKSLPNYVENARDMPLIVCDTSGSMYCKAGKTSPISVALSLGIYTAERLPYPYNNKIITFSSKPSFHRINGETLSDKITSLSKADWGMNTNLERVFQLILNTAKENPNSIVPKKVIIISDMQFDSCVSMKNDKITFYKQMEKMFNDEDLQLPQIVFWNVNSQNSPITIDETGTALVSGCSPVILKQVLSKDLDPVTIMMDVVNSERYNRIKI